MMAFGGGAALGRLRAWGKASKWDEWWLAPLRPCLGPLDGP